MAFNAKHILTTRCYMTWLHTVSGQWVLLPIHRDCVNAAAWSKRRRYSGSLDVFCKAMQSYVGPSRCTADHDRVTYA